MMLTTIGRYQIKAELGRGGMSTVYLARDPRFNRDVAIKLLPHELLHQPTFRARFEREAKIVAALDIPAIVPVYDYGEEDSQPYLVMRYMAGGTLADQMQGEALPLAEVARILDNLAPALDEAHARGIIHRDLKPSNILFDLQGNPHISDFGTALITQAPIKLTDTGGAVGTPAYMSPEQIRGERTLDGRSDLYSLAIITYEVLSGKHPFQTTTPIGIAVKHIIDPVPHIRDSNPELPPFCQLVITKALAKNREDRFPTVTEFAQAMNQTTVAKGTADIKPNQLQPTSPPTTFRQRWPAVTRRRVLWAGLLLIITLFTIGSSILIGDRETAPTASLTAVKPAAAATETVSIVPAQPPATSSSSAAKTAVPAISPAPTDTAVTAPFPSTEPAATHQTVTLTTAQSASIYAQPDADSPELAILLTGETVIVQGRSENGHWLFVRDEAGITGFVYAARIGWDGDAATLSIVQPTATPEPTATTCESGCTRLKIDAYPLPGGRCEAGAIYTTVFMRGQGGSGIYTYFWNDKQMAGPLENEGFGFEVNNLSGAVIGRAKVVSSDGQSAERELFISDFSCE